MPPQPFALAQRLQPLRYNVFAAMDQAKSQARSAGQSVLDLSLGSSDLPTPPHVLAAIAQALPDPSTHGYLLHHQTLDFRRAAAQWYTRKFGVAVDPETEVLLLIGSQEGTAHLPLAVLNPGDGALLCDPCYPSHSGGIHLAGGQIHGMPLRADRGFLPDFGAIADSIAAQCRLMVLSYPHNPTTAVAPLAFWEEAVAFCQRWGIVLVHDFPYPDFAFGEAPAPSVFQADPSKSTAIEFFSLSKSYHMGGFRVGYAIGNRDLIAALRQVKAAIDFNQYEGILRGAIAALTGPQDCVAHSRHTFQQRRDHLVSALHHLGWPVPLPPSTLYLWAPLPEPWHQDSVGFCTQLVTQTGLALSPGVGFGSCGEGYVRFALVQDLAGLTDAVERLARFLAAAA